MVITFTEGAKSEFHNRRSTPRWAIQGQCLYQVNGDREYHRGVVEDLGFRGCNLKTHMDLALSSKIQLIINVTDSDVIRVSGTVQWQRMAHQNYAVGVRFFNVSQKAQEVILQYAHHTDRQALVNHWFKGWED